MDLPTYNEPKKSCRIIDYSEPFFVISILFGCAGIIVNVISSEGFDLALGVFCSLAGLVGLWRVRVLGIAKKLMDSISVLRFENGKLSETTDNLKIENDRLKNFNGSLETNIGELEKTVGKFQKLVGLVDVQSKTCEEVQNELLELIGRYEKENDRQERNNKISMYYTMDQDRDGVLSGDEIEFMKDVMGKEYGVMFKDDSEITRKEFIDRLFKKKLLQRDFPLDVKHLNALKKQLSKFNASNFKKWYWAASIFLGIGIYIHIKAFKLREKKTA